MKATIKDQDGNQVLEANEQVVLTVEIENNGDGPAREMVVEVVGHPVLVKTLGRQKVVGEIASGWKKTVILTGILPEELPQEDVEVSVQIRNHRREVVRAESVRASLGHEKSKGENGNTSVKSGTTDTMSDVDEIPPQVVGTEREHAVALVVGIGRYQAKEIPAVKYARRDAEIMARYLERIAGVPRKRILVLLDENATFRAVKAGVEEWLSRSSTSRSTVFVYFAGHGMPDSNEHSGWLVPTDAGISAGTARCYSLSQLYAALGKLPTRKVILILDTSFAGNGGRSIRPSGVSQHKKPPADAAVAPPGVTIFAATADRQVAAEYDQGLHGLFTYYLLRGLRGEADADHNQLVDAGELFAYVRGQVSQVASNELHLEQTPLLQGQLTLPVARWKGSEEQISNRRSR